MNIRNTTRFSKEAYYALNKTLSSKIYIACIVFEIVLGVLAAFIMIKDKDLLKGGIIILMMLAYPFVLFAIMNGQIRKNYEINNGLVRREPDARLTFSGHHEILK